ncbi:carbohydrate ABC transporter ATP-binding protein (CUT1 family) [Sinobaca qinghaiensis]|uniref:Carbohydrate ABC transporter ATP-binding protein (CUT1 family) n=1 Tax=Sinobaca qinghaiensis TaxID=342944 RepID=A0A419V7Y5_9BACL|nr:sn-glycerol-3-phosphate ABC transporter ATP-binding protein UgpC [Sinobaca qinghaiensis]RKD76167.1 carbohydrate ABC transporter ATP-binding protein (CUT1 family) [Sinobaca qinghaiensis]
MATIDLKNIYKSYDGGDTNAVTDFNLNIEDKEFIVFVGPSGCGKSTTLRMIAGLEDISDGDLVIDDVKVNDLPPKDRDIAMVFQNYALYPHMSVYDNMAFGLKLKKFKKEEIDKRVQNAASILGLEEYLKRKPKALSGGQRQRVALGRAIVRDPKVFLMDEPLSNLDAKLRVQMRAEIIKLHKRLQSTTIYVTHDQTEAMTMATRIVIMKDGFVQQVGSPKHVYDHPVNMFVAGFIGSPAMNFLEGKLVENKFRVGETELTVPEGTMKKIRQGGFNEKELVLGVRPEDIHSEVLFTDSFPDSTFTLPIEVAEMNGADVILYSNLGGQEVIARVDSRDNVSVGDNLKVAIDMNKVHFFDKETKQSITDQDVLQQAKDAEKESVNY